MVHSQFPSPWNLTKVSIFSFLGSWPRLSVQSATSCLFWCPNESLFWDPPSSLKYLPGPRTAAYYPINPSTFLSLLALGGILKSSLSSGSFNIESLLNAKHLLLLCLPFTWSSTHSPLKHSFWQNKSQETHCLLRGAGSSWNEETEALVGHRKCPLYSFNNKAPITTAGANGTKNHVVTIK